MPKPRTCTRWQQALMGMGTLIPIITCIWAAIEFLAGMWSVESGRNTPESAQTVHVVISSQAVIAFACLLYLTMGFGLEPIARSDATCFPVPKELSLPVPQGARNVPGEPGYSYCVRCLVWRDAYAHHCSICQRCEPLFDHHCRFLGVCVGGSTFPPRGNMTAFRLAVWVLPLTSFSTMLYGLKVVVDNTGDEMIPHEVLYGVAIGVGGVGGLVGSIALLCFGLRKCSECVGRRRAKKEE